MNMREQKRAYRFGQSVSPSTSDELSFRVPADGTIESLRLRIYVGAELNLRIRPYVLRKGDQLQEDIVHYPDGKKYLDGDDDVFTFETSIPVFLDDEIKIAYENVDTNYTFDFAVDMTIDYLGGAYRG